MKNAHLVMLVVLLFSISCGNKKTEKAESPKSAALPVIDIEAAMDNPTTSKMNFSEFVNDITYVPLETHENFVFGGRMAPVYTISENYIFAGNMMFDRNGKFIRKLGKIGQGPEEYVLARGITVDEAKGVFYVYDNPNHDIISYNFDNKFLTRTKVHESGNSIYSLGNERIIVMSGIFFDNYFEYQIIDNATGKVLYERETHQITKEDRNNKNLSKIGVNHLWNFEDTTKYYETITDTIFSLKDGVVNQPLYKINLGKYKCTLDLIREEKNWNADLNNYLSIGQISESSKYLFFSLTMGKTLYYASYNKKTEEVKLSEFSEFFNNDIDGGYTWLFHNTSGGTTGFVSLLPYVMKERLPDLSVKNKGYDKDKYKQLQHFVDQIDEDDNEVICFFNLK